MILSNDPAFRPPGEAHSFVLQVDEGCPWNRCTFCGMYKGMPYRRRTLVDVLGLIAQESRRDPGARRIFLADGDVMSRPCSELRAILQALRAHFPRLTRVSMYANGASIVDKTNGELAELKSLKLHTLYMGLESGADDILRRCQKREAAAEMIAACSAAQAAGLRMSVMILLGLGGTACSAQHIERTADVLHRMQPRLLSALRVIPVAGTRLHAEMCSGAFVPLTEYGAVRELREMIVRLALSSTVFRANHSSNVVPLEGRFPHDKARLVAALDALLASDVLDRETSGPMPMWL
ncbi:MAG: radical SAM protein [Kiritimatiellia bacterium]